MWLAVFRRATTTGAGGPVRPNPALRHGKMRCSLPARSVTSSEHASLPRFTVFHTRSSSSSRATVARPRRVALPRRGGQDAAWCHGARCPVGTAAQGAATRPFGRQGRFGPQRPLGRTAAGTAWAAVAAGPEGQPSRAAGAVEQPSRQPNREPWPFPKGARRRWRPSRRRHEPKWLRIQIMMLMMVMAHSLSHSPC